MREGEREDTCVPNNILSNATYSHYLSRVLFQLVKKWCLTVIKSWTHTWQFDYVSSVFNPWYVKHIVAGNEKLIVKPIASQVLCETKIFSHLFSRSISYTVELVYKTATLALPIFLEIIGIRCTRVLLLFTGWKKIRFIIVKKNQNYIG